MSLVDHTDHMQIWYGKKNGEEWNALPLEDYGLLGKMKTDLTLFDHI